MNILFKIILLGLIVSLLTPGVPAVSFGLKSGGSSGTGSVGFAVSADKDALVKGSISANGASLLPKINIDGLGNLKEDHQVTDTDGNHAEIHAEVVRGWNIHYEDSLKPGEGSVTATGSVSAEQTLTVGQSDYIKCTQSASNSNYLESSAGLEIEHGSLTNYKGIAIAAFGEHELLAQQTFSASDSNYIRCSQITHGEGQHGPSAGIEVEHGSLRDYFGSADLSKTIAQQTFTADNYNHIRSSLSANLNYDHHANSNVEIEHGCLTNYQGSAIVANLQDVRTQQALTVGRSDYIRGFQNALRPDGREVSADVEIDHGSLTKYEGSSETRPWGDIDILCDAQQTLTVGDSNYVKGSQSVSDAGGHKASADLEVGIGYLTNYYGIASVNSGRFNHLGVRHAFDSANGKQIEIDDRTSASDETAEARTDIQDGKISGFSSAMYAFFYDRHYTNFEPELGETYSEASGKEIETKVSSSDQLIGKSTIMSKVEDGIVSNCHFDTGWSNTIRPYGDLSSESIAGKRIELETSASNVERDRASVSTYVDDGVASNLVINAESGSQSAHANQNLDALTGREITVDTTASNAEKDKANAGIEIEGTKIQYGSISNLGSVADATVTAVSASQNNLNSLSISGNTIDLDASASDKNGNTATLNTEVQKGTITDILSMPVNGVNVDTSANTLSAYQIASVVTGKKLAIDATAKNAGNVKKHGYKTASNPSNIAFHNTGSVTANSPAVDQGTP